MIVASGFRLSKSSSKVIGSSHHLPVPRRPMRVMNVARSGQRCLPRSRVPQSGHSYTVWGAAAFWPECRGGDERAMTATIRGLAASVETSLPSVGISLPPFTRRKPRSAWSIPVTVAGRQDGTGATPEGRLVGYDRTLRRGTPVPDTLRVLRVRSVISATISSHITFNAPPPRTTPRSRRSSTQPVEQPAPRGPPRP